jgi:MtN3 and saliva related transmembrane protein
MGQAIGFTAATLTALAFLPQVIKAWCTKSTGDISMVMLVSQGSGVTLWIVYGVSIRSAPVILSNVVSLILTLLLLVFTQIYGTVPADR